MNTEILEEIGLTRTQIKTYLTLLETGASSAGFLVKQTKLPNSTIHRNLNSLIEKGLVNFIYQSKRKVYQATDPNEFLRFLEEKKQRFKQILPELKAKQEQQLAKNQASVFQGIRGLKEVYSIMINTKAKEYNTFGGGKITTTILSDTWWLNLHKKRVANKLPSRQVFDETVKTIGNTIAKNKLTNIRYVAKEFAQFQETIIVGNKVAIAVFSKNPYAFLIEDINVANSYRKHFELLWNIGK